MTAAGVSVLGFTGLNPLIDGAFVLTGPLKDNEFEASDGLNPLIDGAFVLTPTVAKFTEYIELGSQSPDRRGIRSHCGTLKLGKMNAEQVSIP